MEILEKGFSLGSADRLPGRRKGRADGLSDDVLQLDRGVTHRFNELLSVRPEVRYEYAFSARPYDNGTRSGQLMFAIDMIARF